MKILAWLFPKHRDLRLSCPACGALAGLGHTYCQVCSTRLDQQFLSCPSCKQTLSPTARFCPHCQVAIQPERAAREATTIIWRRQPGQFARKLDLNHKVFAEPEVRTAGFLVEFGSRALVIVDGALAGELVPGRYPQYLGKDGLATNAEERNGIYNLITKAQKFVSAVIIQSTDQDMSFLFGLGGSEPKADRNLLLTRDNQAVGVDCALTVRLADAVAFFQNLMGPHEVIDVGDLKNHFYEEMRDAIREEVAKYEAEALLRPSRATKDSIESSLSGILTRSLQRGGLALVQLRSLFVGHQAIQKLAEERGRLDLERRKLDVRKQWMSLGNQERYAQAASAADLEKALLDVDRERIMSREEYDEIKRAYDEGRGNRELSLKYLNSRLDLNLRVEYERLKLVEEGKLTLTQIDTQIAQRRKELEFRYEQTLREADLHVAVKQKELEVWKARNQALLDMQRQQLEMNAAVQGQYIAALGQLPPETAGLWLAQHPEVAKVLVERAKTTGYEKIVEAYQLSAGHIKDVAGAFGVGAQGLLMAGTAHGMAWGLGAPRVAVTNCQHCGCGTIPHGARFCPTCGKELRVES